jgi:NodT family efflux transporter outer membrane factor (OMF) lipoprotein
MVMSRRPRRVAFAGAPLVLVALAAACSVGPNYVRPSAPVPSRYKELDGWKAAEPQDEVRRGAWWGVFGDPALSHLEEQTTAANQDLAAAEARFRQARALVAEARAAWWPTVSVGVSATRSHQSGTLGTSFSAGITANNYAMPIEASWEVDLWGRIRRNVESNEASAQASAADVEAARLSLQAALATDYFQLRALDADRRLLDATVEDYARSLALTRSRYAQGVASQADVAQAETQLESTRTQATDVGLQRAQLEHAIAVLVGTPAGDFALPEAPLAATPPRVPPGVPSTLLERRPDVAAAERSAAAANAQIGVATAAYFPTITLSASGGFQSSNAADWFLWPSRAWSFGPSVTETVFDGGRRGAVTAEARAAYDETVAAYRQSVLAAFQSVEDALAALVRLEEESATQTRAVEAADRSLRLTRNRYAAGVASYIDVVVTQAVTLANERAAVDILGRRMVASVALIQALGGGWSTDDLPSGPGLASGLNSGAGRMSMDS